MGILVDHETQFEWSREAPAVLVASAILLAALALFVLVTRRTPGWIETRAGAVAVAGFAFLLVTLGVGIWGVQPDPYRVCGPVLHRWWDRPNCHEALAPYRSAFITLGAISFGLLCLSLVLDATHPDGGASPPPGTTR